MRFRPVTKTAFTAAQSAMDAKAGKTGPYRAFMYAPELWFALQPVREYMSTLSILDNASREAAMLVIARHWESGAAMNAHVSLARNAGLDDELIQNILDDRVQPTSNCKTSMIITCCHTLLKNHGLSNALFAQTADEIGEQGLMELISLIGFFTTICLVLNTMEVDAAPKDDAIEPI